MNNRGHNTYLGDAVYVRDNELGEVILYTHNGIRETNVIVMEPSVLKYLTEWLRKRGEANASEDVQQRGHTSS